MNLTSLMILDLDNNSLRGIIPDFLYDLTSLKTVDLNSNLFSGTIPSQISLLSNLNFLDISDNYFNGTIPTGINALTTLSKSDSAIAQRTHRQLSIWMCFLKSLSPHSTCVLHTN
jgi:Leucine-rich repeat (LRR) protein